MIEIKTPLSDGRGGGGEAAAYYQQGNEHRRRGDWQQALNCYMEAIALDPESPAVEAKKMLDDILNFYHKDSYNP
ncbi:MAG: tetratricopeptide repeat protein [Prevotella sp.]|nr:tetratricopeptide repeat protein [Prevotella sp.]